LLWVFIDATLKEIVCSYDKDKRYIILSGYRLC